jgi:hypothetical protein
MANDDIERIEAVFGAISKIAAGEEAQPELGDAKCPRCGGQAFAHVPDVYSEAVARIEVDPKSASAVHIGGLTDLEIVKKLRPERRKSAALPTLIAAIPLAAAATYTYWRFGDSAGQLAIMGAIVLTLVVLLTMVRRKSDDFYHRRQRRNRLFMCRSCGQLVTS